MGRRVVLFLVLDGPCAPSSSLMRHCSVHLVFCLLRQNVLGLPWACFYLSCLLAGLAHPRLDPTLLLFLLFVWSLDRVAELRGIDHLDPLDQAVEEDFLVADVDNEFSSLGPSVINGELLHLPKGVPHFEILQAVL